MSRIKTSDIRKTPDMTDNEIYSFFCHKYNNIDKEIFYLSGIGYIYKCLDQMVSNAGFNNLCEDNGKLCTKCCNRQEAHVSLAEMVFFIENHSTSWYNYLELVFEQLKQDPKKCSDLFFLNNNCSIYPDRFFICRAYMNLFNGEPYCPRHNSEILIGQAVDNIVDCFYYFIDQLTQINKTKYYGSITPTNFFLQEYLMSEGIKNKKDIMIFFEQNSFDISWLTTHKMISYSVGLLGTTQYSPQYIKNVQAVSQKLSEN